MNVPHEFIQLLGQLSLSDHLAHMLINQVVGIEVSLKHQRRDDLGDILINQAFRRQAGDTVQVALLVQLRVGALRPIAGVGLGSLLSRAAWSHKLVNYARLQSFEVKVVVVEHERTENAFIFQTNQIQDALFHAF